MKVTEIRCLERLEELNGGMDSIMSFLIEEKLMDQADAKRIMSEALSSKALHSYINALKNSTAMYKINAVQMVEYEWQVLPVERIKIIIVTDRSSREFSYNF